MIRTTFDEAAWRRDIETVSAAMDVQERLGSQVLALRRAAGLTQTKFGRFIDGGMTESRIGMVESGGQLSLADTSAILVAFFDIVHMSPNITVSEAPTAPPQQTPHDQPGLVQGSQPTATLIEQVESIMEDWAAQRADPEIDTPRIQPVPLLTSTPGFVLVVGTDISGALRTFEQPATAAVPDEMGVGHVPAETRIITLNQELDQ